MLQHLLPLPLFITLSKDLFTHAVIAWNSPQLIIPVVGIAMPRMIVWLIGNVLTQYPFKIFDRRMVYY